MRRQIRSLLARVSILKFQGLNFQGLIPGLHSRRLRLRRPAFASLKAVHLKATARAKLPAKPPATRDPLAAHSAPQTRGPERRSFGRRSFRLRCGRGVAQRPSPLTRDSPSRSRRSALSARRA